MTRTLARGISLPTASGMSTTNPFAAGAGLNAARTASSNPPAEAPIVQSAPKDAPSGRPQPKAFEKVRSATVPIEGQPPVQPLVSKS